MATYLLYGLGPSVTSISSSEGWSGQPTLNFPADTSKHPSREASGVQFNKGDYLSFSTHFDNQGADYITAILWIYRNDKEINEFFQIGHNFSKAGYAQGVGELTLETKSSGSKARAEINGDDVSNADENLNSNKWNLVGFGWGNNKGYFKIKRNNGGDEDNNRTHTVSSWDDRGTDYFVGDFNNDCEGGCEYTVHSIRIFSDERPGVEEDFWDAPYNQWFGSWASGTRDAGEECDDGNYNEGDGCDEDCKVENNYEWNGGTATTPDVWNLIWQSNSSPADQTVDWYDDNAASGDGCNSSCKVETGYSCSWDNSDDRSYCTDKCGDGITIISMGASYCDDGDKDSGDGWSSSCSVESGWNWSGGDTSNPDTCTDDCGDGKVMDVQAGYWDDNNNAAGDGWNAACQIETYWTCTSGSSSVQSVWSDTCGDGRNMKPAAGYWDDGDKDDGDGCSSSWAVESGWTWSGGDSTNSDSCSDDCGDGKVMTPSATYWDDGDKTSGDGCSSICQPEAGWSCTQGDSSTQSVWTDSWGDGKVMDPTAGYWDDGDNDSGDGWSATWQVESGWTCTLGDSSTASVCTDDWGDGKVMNVQAGYWDDGDNDDGDGCSSTWAVETGWTWTAGDSSTASTCSDTWGDSKVMDPQAGYWDDGGKVNNDGCDSSCAVESGWDCTLGDSSTASVCTDDCGDGKVMNVQAGYWDDGDNDNGDGCSSTWAVETGWTWTPGDSSTASTCSDTWGDSKVMDPQAGYWDDGAKVNNDGCDSSWAVESGWTCTLGDSSTTSVCTDDCGDGKVMDPASGYCDDGDKDDGDGCSSSWAVETGWTCTAGDSTAASSCSDTWGDSKVIDPQSGYWDDGGKVNNDGCDSSWAVESGWTCTLGDSSTASICSDIWGDGVVLKTAAAYWDDGDKTSGDGWSSACAVETGWTWTLGDSSTASVCSDDWGDGKVMSPASGYWDDGAKVGGDGWSSSCQVESGWTCTAGDSSTASSCSDTWGDGIVMDPQSGYWDDGNSIDGDGCSSTWAVETGWAWSLGDSSTGSTCTEICGDSKVMVPTAGYWDDGGKANGDGCNSNWAVEAGFTCTLGDSSTASLCSDICGDGKIMTPHSTYWDDGNTNSGDGCSSTCQVESNVVCTSGDSSTASICSDTCGDGFVSLNNLPPNYWDDGNKVDGDGCSSSCSSEQDYVWEGGSATSKSICKTCSVENCIKCVEGDIYNWSLWSDGYEEDGGQCKIPKVVVGSEMGSASQAAVGGIAALSAVNSVVNWSSPTVLWAMANQLQLLLLLLLTNSSMPSEVIKFLTANRFAAFSLDFLQFEKLPGMIKFKGWFEIQQINTDLSEIGIESGSTFYNNFSLIMLLLLLLPLHWVVLCLPSCKKLAYSDSNWKSRIGKLCGKVKKFLFEVFNFTVYLRLWLEAYQYVMLSCTDEILRLDYEEYASFAVAGVVMLVCVLVLGLAYYIYYSTKKFYDEEQYYYFKEMVRGLKNTKNARIYTFILLLRRFVLVFWLIGMKDSNKYYSILFLSAFQLFYLARIIYARPQGQACDNLVENINELFFTVLSCSLIHLNTKQAWKGFMTELYLYILISNNFVIASIMLSILGYNLTMKLKQKWNRKKKTQPKAVTPKTPEVVVNPLATPTKPISKLGDQSVSRISSAQMFRSTNRQTSNQVQVFKVSKKAPKKGVDFTKMSSKRIGQV